MKSKIFCLLLLIVNSVYSQTVIVDVNEGQPFVKWKKTTTSDVLQSPEWTGYIEKVDVKYVFNLNEMTSTLYRNGTLYDISKLEKYYENDSTLIIEFKAEIPFFSEIKYDASFLIDKNKKTMCLTWYNPYGNYTRTDFSTNIKVTFIPVKINL